MLRLMTGRIAVCLLLAACASYAQDGAAIFQSKCSVCHASGGATQAPLPDALRHMTWQAILTALENGKMKAQGSTLNAPDREAVAKYLGSTTTEVIPRSAYCTTNATLSIKGSAWNGWGVDPVNSRFQTAQASGLAREVVPKLKLKWAFGFPGATTAFATPTVVDGKLFVGSADGTVYALNAGTGCILWTYQASEGVRTAILISSNGQTAYFGDLHANVYALDVTTGALRWKTHVEEHPYATITGTPKLEAGRLYVPVSGGEEEVSAGNPAFVCCKFRGSIVALDAESGRKIWKTYTIAEPAKMIGRTPAGTERWGPSGVSVWMSPTLDLARRAIYVGTGVNFTDPPTKTSDAILVLDVDSGRMLWSQQFIPDDRYNFGCLSDKKGNCPENPGKDMDFGAPPMLRSLPGGRGVLIAGQKSGMVHALDPDQQGKVVWETRIGHGGGQGGVLWGAASDDRLAYFSLSDWDPTKPESGGGVFAIEIATGKKVWSTPAPKPACLGVTGCSAAQPGAPTVIEGVVFAGSLDGHLRAYDSKSGGIIWDVDTLHDFETVNGIKARGGSMNGTGPTIAGGVLYTNSGYSRIPSIPGNVLLAFSVDGK
jgi:polyvinyl alcohol dehydrogenase (cytochrome)